MGRWIVLPGYILFFLMLTFPTVSKILYLKVVLLGIVLVLIGIATLFSRRRWLHPTIGLWTLFLAAVSLFFVVRGFYLEAPGAADTARVYVLWPLIYLVLMVGASRPKILLALQRILVIATIFIGIQGGIYLLSGLGILQWDHVVDLLSLGWKEQAIGFHEGYIGMATPGLNSLPFLIPFTIAVLATDVLRGTRRAVRKIWLWLACILGLFMVLISARRALVLVTILAPLLIWLFLQFQPARERELARKSLGRVVLTSTVGVVVLVIGLSFVYQFNARDLFQRVQEGFNFQDTTFDAGADARRQQFLALLNGWYEHPLLGAGHGASAYGSIRSETMPWGYELSYVALLFQTGLLGFLAYTAGVIWIYRTALAAIRAGGEPAASILPIMVGMSAFLIANATNPYLGKFEEIWVIFLPLAFINDWLLTKSQTSRAILQSPRPVPR